MLCFINVEVHKPALTGVKKKIYVNLMEMKINKIQAPLNIIMRKTDNESDL